MPPLVCHILNTTHISHLFGRHGAAKCSHECAVPSIQDKWRSASIGCTCFSTTGDTFFVPEGQLVLVPAGQHGVSSATAASLAMLLHCVRTACTYQEIHADLWHYVHSIHHTNRKLGLWYRKLFHRLPTANIPLYSAMWKRGKNLLAAFTYEMPLPVTGWASNHPLFLVREMSTSFPFCAYITPAFSGSP